MMRKATVMTSRHAHNCMCIVHVAMASPETVASPVVGDETACHLLVGAVLLPG